MSGPKNCARVISSFSDRTKPEPSRSVPGQMSGTPRPTSPAKVSEVRAGKSLRLLLEIDARMRKRANHFRCSTLHGQRSRTVLRNAESIRNNQIGRWQCADNRRPRERQISLRGNRDLSLDDADVAVSAMDRERVNK